jgi:hypothetical protein
MSQLILEQETHRILRARFEVYEVADLSSRTNGQAKRPQGFPFRVFRVFRGCL